MICAACRHENPDTFAFCEECGARLESRCPSCAAPCKPSAKFCGSCGASIAARPSSTADKPEGRKVVTILFSDLVGSVSLQERLDPESAQRVMERYHRLVRTAVEAHGGSLVQLIGDGVMCAFGVPQVAEDDAIRAVRAGVAVQQAFREFAEEESARVGTLALRVAINTGEVVASGDLPAGIGDPLNIAARLQGEAREGDVLIGESTARLVRELVTLERTGVFSLKGRSGTVAAYRVVSLDRPAGASATPFVGREDELKRIHAVYERAVAERRARLVVVLGSPGLGKSRLTDELERRLGDGATVLHAQCDRARRGTFAPIANALRAHLGIADAATGDEVRAAITAAAAGDDAERKRLADGIAALLAGTPGSPEETFFVVRRLLAALAVERPLVLAFDDLHWAEPLLLDLVEHLIQWTTDAPIFVLAAARPELRDSRSSLTVPAGFVSEVLTLAGLDAGAATKLAASVIGAEELPAAVAGRVLATSEGNPLFVGELVRMLVSDGTLKREGERWTVGTELARVEMPPTIQALLAARIERLRPEERTVLERASVVGRQFSRAAVLHLLPREIDDLDARLEALRRSELIEADTGWLLGEPVLRFHHVLIRDAAYRRLLKNTRAELHERHADWFEGKVGDTVEHDETIGWHLEQAHHSLRDLGPVDERGRALGERAARRLASAGKRALAREDLPLAANLLGRALDHLDAGDPSRADLALDWCEALLASGDVGPAARAIEELGRFVGGSARLRAWHACFAGELAALTDPQSLRATAESASVAAKTLASEGDAPGEAKAYSVEALALARLGKVGACEAALDRALAAARRGHDRRRSNAVLAGAPLAALWGPSPVTRASGRCLDVVRVLRITQGSPAVEAVALRCQGVLEALRGRGEAARRMIASSRRMVEELGITQRLLEADVFAGLIELLEGDAAAAERLLRSAYDGLRAQGLGIDAAQAAALLGRALLALGRAADAETLSHESESLAGDDLQAAIAWRCVRAEALARRGENAAAVELARAAVEIAAATDALLIHADARLALAAALRASGHSHEAVAEEARAIELWEAKGATLLAERARQSPTTLHLERDRAEGPPRPPLRGGLSPKARGDSRRVSPSGATAWVRRMAEKVSAGDADALRPLFHPENESVEHSTGATYGVDGAISSYRLLFECRDPVCRFETLASLGDSLALCRVTMSASGTGSYGAFERRELHLYEVDGDGRQRRAESFALDRLGDALVRLYERHAELLTEGPDRTRSEATARTVAVMAATPSYESLASVSAQDIEGFDHRRIIGLGAGHGAKALLRLFRNEMQSRRTDAFSIEDVLAARPDSLVVKARATGTDLRGGGVYEIVATHLWTFGRDGLLGRIEWFDADRDAEALARLDDLIAEQPARRVRANAATAHAARLTAAIVARDADALSALHAERVDVTEHSTGATYDREGEIRNWRPLLRHPDLVFRLEPQATLGDSLALLRLTASGTGSLGFRRPDEEAPDAEGDRGRDVGSWEVERIRLSEVDADGRARRVEVFEVRRLGDAIVRLYERHAELLPEGPERIRATATARTVAVMLAVPKDVEQQASVFAPDIEGFDHRRVVGLGGGRGAKKLLEVLRGDLATRRMDDAAVEDVLEARDDALAVKIRRTDTDLTGGGTVEWAATCLLMFGSDGLLRRNEWFDTDRETDTLARLDELAEKPARRIRANAASANVTRLDAAIAAGDADGIGALFADDMEVVNHHLSGGSYDRAGAIKTWRSLLRADEPVCRHEPLATLGDCLGLFRQSLSAAGFSGPRFDVGAYERDAISLIECDSSGRQRRADFFSPERLGDAVVLLYERYAELAPKGPARERAAATAHSISELVGPFDPDRYAATVDAEFEYVDHRRVGFETERGKEAILRRVRTLAEVADQVLVGTDEILALRPDGYVLRVTNSGIERIGGGKFERQFLMLTIFGSNGLGTRQELFDTDRTAEALARFDELTSESSPHPTRPIRPNAATAHAARVDAAMIARDTDALSTLYSKDFEQMDRVNGIAANREETLSTLRYVMGTDDLAFRNQPVATLGDALALFRFTSSGSGFSEDDFVTGPLETQRVTLVQTDAESVCQRAEIFASDRLGEAIARLYERYAELQPEGPGRTMATATARSLAVILARDLDRYPAAFASNASFRDERLLGMGAARGGEQMVVGMRSLFEIADDLVFRVDDVLALRPNAVITRETNLGKHRLGGGEFERHFIQLLAFDDNGRLTRGYLFDTDHEAEALARFDELSATPSKPARLVRPNAASALVAHTEAAVAACEFDSVRDQVSDDFECFDHTNLSKWDREGHLLATRQMVESRDLEYRQELLATLGDSLVLTRLTASSSGFDDGNFDTGPVEYERIILTQTNARGLCRRSELFATDRLGDAIGRLYERHAEDVPDGAARQRATATARTVKAVTGPLDERHADVFAEDIEGCDRRRLVGLGPWRGRESARNGIRVLREVGPVTRYEIQEVLALRAASLLLRTRTVGETAQGGGAYERHLVQLYVFGSDGLVIRFEQFDPDQGVEALARFDELTAERPKRRVRPNAATAGVARLDAAVAARDLDAVRKSIPRSQDVIDHTAGANYDERGSLDSFRRLVNARDLEFHHEPLATLGGSLGLFRLSQSASGLARGEFDVADYERELIILTDDRSTEVFAPEKLAEAVARLYQRYAELLPDGPDRERGLARARSVASLIGAFDVDRFTALYSPAIEFVDHRPLGFPAVSGKEANLLRARSLIEASSDITLRLDDVLALEPHALLTVQTLRGTDRATGGAYEMPRLRLWTLGNEGLLERLEWFDVGREQDALARFEELVSKPTSVADARRRRFRSNLASQQAAQLDAAIAAKDPDALSSLFADDCENLDRTTGTTWQRHGAISSFRALMRARNPRCAHEVLATLGDRLALCRVSSSASGFSGGNFDVGPYEREQILLSEVDESGRSLKSEAFAVDRLGDAVARLYERHGELLPEGSARARFTATAHHVAAVVGPFDVDRWTASVSPDLEVVDHRVLGTWTTRGAEAQAQQWRAWFDVVGDHCFRIDDVFALAPDALLAHFTGFGTAHEGGQFERPFIALVHFAADGRCRRTEAFDSDHLSQAFARFDELTCVVNAAARAVLRMGHAWRARDWLAIEALFAPGLRVIDHRSYAHLELDRERHLESLRARFEMSSSSAAGRILATRGDRLCLGRARVFVADGDVGPSEFGSGVYIWEVDEHGSVVTVVLFDPDEPDDLEAAYADLDRRFFEADEAKPHFASLRPDPLRIPPNSASRAHERWKACIAIRDWDALQALLAPNLAWEDRRRMMALTGDRDISLANAEQLVKTRISSTLLATAGDRLALLRCAFAGEIEGGPYEAHCLLIVEVDAEGRVIASTGFDPDDRRAAAIELSERYRRNDAGAPLKTAALELVRGINEHDLGRCRAAVSDDFAFYDHRRTGIGRLESVDDFLASWAWWFEQSPDLTVELLYVVAEEKHAGLTMARMFGTRHGGGFEIVSTRLVRYGADRLVGVELYEPEDLDAARARFEELRPPHRIVGGTDPAVRVR